jgi:chorismate dehydratase
MQKLRISAVSYLNTLPFVYGITHSGLLGQAQLFLDVPSVCADKLIHGQADAGLVPVAAIPLIKNARIISDFCIGADGAVQTVLLVSRIPLDQIKHIHLDLESRTSVALAKVLAREYWNINPVWHALSAEVEADSIEASVLIGDKTFNLSDRFTYTYDLAAEWKAFTGLPFVFACWVVNRKISAKEEQELNDSFAYGLNHKEDAIAELTHLPISKIKLLDYLNNSISFNLDDAKREALKLFLEKIKEIS